MFERDIYTIHSTYREDMHIKGFQFGKGEKSACIVGAARGNEIQQMYICSQLVKTLRELENNGCISAGKQILVIPIIITIRSEANWTLSSNLMVKYYPSR